MHENELVPIDSATASENQRRLKAKRKRKPRFGPTVRTRQMTKAEDGIPGNSVGRKPRTPEPTSPALDARQTRCYEYRLQGLSCSRIAQLMGIDRDTVAVDVQMEGQRRANDTIAQRAQNIAMAVDRYEEVISSSLVIRQVLRNYGLEEKQIEDPSAPGGYRIERKVKSVNALVGVALHNRQIIQAQAKIDALLGSRSTPTVGTPTDLAKPPSDQKTPVLLMLSLLDDDERLKLMYRMTEYAKSRGALPVPKPP